MRLRRELPEIAEVFIDVTTRLRSSETQEAAREPISEPLLFPLVLSGTAVRYTAEAADAETETVITTTAIAAHEGES